MLNLSRRRLEPEMMDNPTLDPKRHGRALEGLERLNQWSFAAQTLWRPLKDLSRNLKGKPLRILDIATGGGDIPRQLWKKAKREGLAFQIEACDRSPFSVQYASQKAAEAGASINFFTLDIFQDSFPANVHVAMSSLFLHHLSEGEAITLLSKMERAATHAILVNDLIRNPAGLALAYTATRVLTHSEVIREDGPQSVRAAFTLNEVEQMAKKAGLRNFRVERHWPFRFLLVARK